MKFHAALLVCASLNFAVPAFGQDAYPSRPITLITSVSAGMTSDIIARMFADKLSRRLGQPVVVQNMPGAGGTVASRSVAAAPADGYTLLTVNVGHSVNPFLYKDLPYDTQRDFTGVALIAESPIVVLVPASLGVRTLKDFIALAKAKPRTINYPSAGVGTVTHLAGALFASLAGIELVHVPYKTMSTINADLLSGRTQAAFFPPGAVLAQIKEGKLLTLGVSTPEPMREPFHVPSVRQEVNIDYIISNWNGIIAPAKTPRPVLERLAAQIQQIAEDEEVKQRYKALGFVSRTLLLREFDAYMKADMERLGPVVKASGARAN
jgi:tripartite-type tricarboxylate transporter receptor subunit TctC